MKCEWKERVLAYLKGNEQDLEIEKHLEECEQCQSLMEGYLARDEAIIFPEEKCNNANLKEQVEHYDKGTKRILIFTIIGLILGWFSYKYYVTDFFPIKIILAIPYKLNELFHTSLHEHSWAYLPHYGGMNSFDTFFPQAYFVSRFAEYAVSSLIGGAIYGSFGYFTGDKRVFTLTRYLKFAIVWICIILLTISGTFLANHIAVEKNHKFEDMTGIFIHYESGGSGFYNDDTEEHKQFFKALEQAFYADGKIKPAKNQKRDGQNEKLIEFLFDTYHSRHMAAFINLQEKYLVSDTGTIYLMSDEFCQEILSYQKQKEAEKKEVSQK